MWSVKLMVHQESRYFLKLYFLSGMFLISVFTFLDNITEEKMDNQLNVESRDNRTLIDNNKAQSLTGEDIQAMKR